MPMEGSMDVFGGGGLFYRIRRGVAVVRGCGGEGITEGKVNARRGK